MAGIIADIEKLNENLEPREPLGKGTVTISQIRSTSPSLCAVADGCTIHLDRRLTVGETEETSVAEILELPAVKAAKATVTVLEYAVPSYTGLTYPTRKYYPTWEMPADGREMQTAMTAYRDAFGKEPEIGHQRRRNCWYARHPVDRFRPRPRALRACTERTDRDRASRLLYRILFRPRR
jgi:acetylornithine deacetylase/succinyl-diaminopimelate desuccinylase-like protein